MADGNERQEHDVAERPANKLMPGFVGLFVTAAMVVIAVIEGVAIHHRMAADDTFWGPAGMMILFCVLTLWSMARFEAIAPYERLVISRFGTYVGVETRQGLGWLIPFHGSKTVSTALSNFETETVKVNDHGGSPIDIGVVVVHRVTDAAKAVYKVNDVEEFVEQQVIVSLRAVAARHDYDGEESKAVAEAVEETETQPKREAAAREDGTGKRTLRGDIEEVSEELRDAAQKRIGDIGVEIMEVRISHLAYAPEIAAAMLRRQQAKAMVAARETLVTGAVSIVQETMDLLEKKGMKLDEERRATLTSNLLVVLASDREAAPVLPVAAA